MGADGRPPAASDEARSGRRTTLWRAALPMILVGAIAILGVLPTLWSFSLDGDSDAVESPPDTIGGPTTTDDVDGAESPTTDGPDGSQTSTTDDVAGEPTVTTQPNVEDTFGTDVTEPPITAPEDSALPGLEAGALTSRWPDRLRVGDRGLIEIEIRVLDPNRDFAEQIDQTEAYIASQLPALSDSIRVDPVYVVPGPVELTLRAQPGLAICDNESCDRPVRQRSWTRVAQQGSPASIVATVIAEEAGASGIEILGSQIDNADPLDLIPPDLIQFDINAMRLLLRLRISVPDPPSQVDTTTAPSELGDQLAEGVAEPPAGPTAGGAPADPTAGTG
ncbi:MAG: hypothetical protein AAF547_23165, partial [Actinomycetota bacterium]